MKPKEHNAEDQARLSISTNKISWTYRLKVLECKQGRNDGGVKTAKSGPSLERERADTA